MPEYQYAIIVPAWNEAAFIESTVKSIQEAMSQVALHGQLIVVDNNSSDDTAKRATEAGAQVVFEPVNQIARSRNAGAASAEAEYLIFVDADTLINGPLLNDALQSLQGGEVVAGGSCIVGDRKPDFLTQFGISSWNSISRVFKIAAGCFLYTRADAFRDVGGFPEERYAGEELVLSRRVRAWGKERGMRFHIFHENPVETSLRKLDWYSPYQLFKQYILAIFPSALKSKQSMNTWYDDSIDRTQKNVEKVENSDNKSEHNTDHNTDTDSDPKTGNK